jgi:hypothetical protein
MSRNSWHLYLQTYSAFVSYTITSFSNCFTYSYINLCYIRTCIQTNGIPFLYSGS